MGKKIWSGDRNALYFCFNFFQPWFLSDCLNRNPDMWNLLFIIKICFSGSKWIAQDLWRNHWGTTLQQYLHLFQSLSGHSSGTLDWLFMYAIIWRSQAKIMVMIKLQNDQDIRVLFIHKLELAIYYSLEEGEAWSWLRGWASTQYETTTSLCAANLL